ncbi:MAG: hypothetical protein KA885_12120, partial [Spirochaetes bacterium]|nr:hypothetical protein [Spirochaetota bacterium]
DFDIYSKNFLDASSTDNKSEFLYKQQREYSCFHKGYGGGRVLRCRDKVRLIFRYKERFCRSVDN